MQQICWAHLRLDPKDWAKMKGLAWLHEDILKNFPDWKIWGLGDSPEANSKYLLGLLGREPFDVVVVGGHGNPLKAGVVLKDGPWCGNEADLGSIDLLVLVACAVGRVNQEGDRDIERLYSRLLVHRGRSVVAARWRIADAESS